MEADSVSKNMTNMQKLQIVLAAGMLSLSTLAARADDRAVSPSSAQRVSLTYSVEVTRAGKPVRTRPSAGDEIRFRVQPNIDGYMYVIASSAGGGEYELLYPAKGSKESNVVRKGQDYSFPRAGIAMSEAEGLKSVKMVLSKTRLQADPSMLMSRSIKIGGIFVKELGLTRPAKSRLVEEHPQGFDNANSVTVESVELNPEKPLEIDISLASLGATGGTTIGGTPLNATAVPEPVSAYVPATAGDYAVKADLPPVGKKYALLVGIKNFGDPRFNLMYADKDATDVGAFLTSGGEFAPANVTVLTNRTATSANILANFDAIVEKVRPGDLVFVYMSTRACANESPTDSYLVTADANPENPRCGGLSLDKLSNEIKKLGNVRVVVVLDTNHMEGDSQSATVLNTQTLANRTGQLIVSSASGEQKSHTSLGYQNSIFAKHLLDGLRKSPALKSAFDYAAQKTDEESMKDFYSHQKPQLYAPVWQLDQVKI
jgi:hypothetical protein